MQLALEEHTLVTSLTDYPHNLKHLLQVVELIYCLDVINVSFLLPIAFDVSLASSLLGIPFSTNVGGLTVYRCGATPRYVSTGTC